MADIDRGHANYADENRGYKDAGQQKSQANKDFKAALAVTTGRTPDQLRQTLAGFAARQQQTQIDRARIITSQPLPPVIGVTETRIEPAQFVNQNTQTNPGSGGGAGNAAIQPPNFTVLTRSISGVAVWGVLFGSTVSNNPRSATADASVTGTLTNTTPTNSDTGWFTISASDSIWLKVTFSTWPTVSGYSIETLAASTFDGGTAEYVSDGMTPPTYTQTFARVVLAKATQSGGVILTFQQKAIGSPILWETPMDAALSGGGSVQSVICVMPIF